MADFHSILDAFYSAYAERDAARAGALYPEDGWHEEVAMSKRRTGREAVAEGLAGFFRMLPDVTWSEEQRILSGRQAAVLYTMRGTFTPRPKEGAEAPQPKTVVLKGLHLFEFSDDGLIGTKDLWNLDSFKQQIA